MSKGESILVFIDISKSFNSFKQSTPIWFTSSPKWEIVGIMIQVLSLMETHSQVSLDLIKVNSHSNMSIKRLHEIDTKAQEVGTKFY